MGILFGGVFVMLLGVRIIGVLVGWCFVFFLMVIISLSLVVVIYVFVEDVKLFFFVDLVRLVNICIVVLIDFCIGFFCVLFLC